MTEPDEPTPEQKPEPPAGRRPQTLRQQFRRPRSEQGGPWSKTWRAVWGVLLSLGLPGLGQIYARAWRIGIILLVINEALSLAARVITVAAPPLLPALAALGVVLIAGIGLMLVAAIDAARRIRRDPAPQRLLFRARWYRSTWIVALVVFAIGYGCDAALPFGWRAFDIPSSSMAPTLMVGDYLLADKRRGYVPSRGDVIVFTREREPEVDYVKRIIGLPGDRIALKDGTVILNGIPAPQTQGADVIIPEDMSFGIKARRGSETLPAGGGGSGVTHDIYRIPGAAVASNMDETTVPPGRLFVMGDNRDNSLDSRFPKFGPIAIADIVGPARTLYWSRDRSRILTAVR